MGINEVPLLAIQHVMFLPTPLQQLDGQPLYNTNNRVQRCWPLEDAQHQDKSENTAYAVGVRHMLSMRREREKESIKPFQPHRADAGAARTSPRSF